MSLVGMGAGATRSVSSTIRTSSPDPRLREDMLEPAIAPTHGPGRNAIGLQLGRVQTEYGIDVNQIGPLLRNLALKIGDQPGDLRSLRHQGADHVRFRHDRIALPPDLPDSRMPGIAAARQGKAVADAT